MGAIGQQAVTPIDGYMKGFVINGFILIVSGLLGLLLLRPDTELARLRLFSRPDAVRDRTFDIAFLGPGADAFAFTFG